MASVYPTRRPALISRTMTMCTMMTALDDGYRLRHKHLYFIVSECQEADGRWWIHASVSRMDREMPTYEDLMLLKRIVIGDDRTAIQVFPPQDHHIDVAGKLTPRVEVLHLWSPERDFLPDFSHGKDSL